MPLPLLALFFAAFAFGTTEFVIAGVLPQVAAGLGVSVPSAGYLVSGYAAGIAVGGPLLTIATSRVPRKTLLVWLLVDLHDRTGRLRHRAGLRLHAGLGIVIAFAHGVYFGVAMVVGIGLVRPEQRGMAVALILAGLTVSGIVGVPLGTAIGTSLGLARHLLGDVRARHPGHACDGHPRSARHRCNLDARRACATRCACSAASRSGPASSSC